MRTVDGLLLGTNDGVFSSPDTQNWTRVFGVPNQPANTVWGIAWSADLEIWACATHELFWSSEDGRAFTPRTVMSPQAGAPPALSVAPWGFVAGGVGGRIWTTGDGRAWVERAAVPAAVRVSAFASTDSICVLVTDDWRIMSSTTGSSWTTRMPPPGLGNIGAGIAVSPGGEWIVVGSPGVAWKSSTGTSWTQISVPWDTPAQAVCWDPTRNGWLVADHSGRVWAAVGASWTLVATAPAVVWSITPTGFDGTVLVGATGWTGVMGADGWRHDVPVTGRCAAAGPVRIAPPSTPALVAPTDGATVAFDRTNRFSWSFHGPDAGDRQSGYELRYRLVGAPTWTTAGAESANTWRDLGSETFSAGLWEWQVRVAGRWGDWSPWSDSGFFVAAVSPEGPAIISPVNGATIGAGAEPVEWSVPAQVSYQVRRVADDGGSPDLGLILWDSGEVVSASARSRQVVFPTNNQFEHVQLRVKSGGLWSGWDSVRVEVSYTPPAVPSVATTVFTVGAPALEAGLRYQVTNPAPAAGEPTVTSVEIWRRKKGDPGDGIRVAKDLVPNSFFNDWAVASGQEYEVRVRAYGDNGTSTWSAWEQDTTGYLALPDGGFVELVGW